MRALENCVGEIDVWSEELEVGCMCGTKARVAGTRVSDGSGQRPGKILTCCGCAPSLS